MIDPVDHAAELIRARQAPDPSAVAKHCECSLYRAEKAINEAYDRALGSAKVKPGPRATVAKRLPGDAADGRPRVVNPEEVVRSKKTQYAALRGDYEAAQLVRMAKRR